MVLFLEQDCLVFCCYCGPCIHWPGELNLYFLYLSKRKKKKKEMVH